jgi:nucleoside-diphosphate-sugar epimerase
MRILLAGATGAIGRPLVRRLIDAGHEVVGLSRNELKAQGLDATGARGVVCDVCDRRRVLALAE